MKVLILAAALVTGAAVGPTSAQVTASAMSDVTETLGSMTFRIGVMFELEPQWHVYWKHPGDSGLPTEITATGPEGIEIGPWRYPVPERFGQPGGIAGFGYSDRVLLVADVRAEAGRTDPITIDLVADWLMCKDRCIPGRAESSITVDMLPPYSSLARRPSQHADTFDEWETHMPEPAGAKHPFSLNVNRADGTGKLTIGWPDAAPAAVDWIPNPPFELAIDKIEVTEDAKSTTIVFVWEKWGKLPSPTLDSLISWTDADGRRRGRDIQFDLY